MKKNSLVFYLLIILFFTFAISLFLKHKKITTFEKQERKAKQVFSTYLYDSAYYSQAYEAAEKYTATPTDRVYGGIIPHHLLAGQLIAGFFKGIEKQKINRVILLSPNHYIMGKSNIETTEGLFKTAFGLLYSDSLAVLDLAKKGTAEINSEVFKNEHGIYGIAPFIKKTFPSAKIIPLVIKSGTPKKELDLLAVQLFSLADEKTIIMVSSDFSHYLTLKQAQVHDEESISALQEFAPEKILNLNNPKNTDSPESLYTFIEVMRKKQVNEAMLISHTNSAKLASKQDLLSTTSYVSMYFTKRRNDLSDKSIFRYVAPENETSKNQNSREYSLIATGDVIPARSVNAKMVTLKDFNFPFKKTVNLLRSADLLFINLEAPLVPGCKTTIEGMIFCGDERDISGLIYAGVNVASIANNHSGNYGTMGIENTTQLLKKSKIGITGNGSSSVIQIKDKRFGFLGYNDIGGKSKGIAYADNNRITDDIKKLKTQADFVVVGFHWGDEYTLIPNYGQISLAHTAVDAGADLVIGNHPHTVQGTEIYKGKFITYAHGNFVFDQMWSRETREGVIGKYTFNEKGLKSVVFIPTVIDNFSQPRFATKIEAEKILSRMKESTERIRIKKLTFLNN